MDIPVQMSAFWGFSVEDSGLRYSWRGTSPEEKANTIEIYNSHSERWTSKCTSGPPPSGLYSGGCVCLEKNLYCFVGYVGSCWRNDLYKLNCETFQWSKLHPQNADLSEVPMHKTGCSLFAVDEDALGCFGGYGIGQAQPGSTFIKNGKGDSESGWTNEFHLYNLRTGATIVYICFL